MTTASADPNRFKPFHESLLATVVRTGSIAIVLASILTLIRMHHIPVSPAQWHIWLASVVFAGWITFGGHWVEIFYLNVLRPKIATWSDAALVFVRLAVWIAGGTILVFAGVLTSRLIASGALPARGQMLAVLFYGGPLFAIIELFPHIFLQLAGRPSFWNLRG